MGDMLGSYRFQPYSLPDTCDWCIPDTFRSFYLFSSRLFATVRGVPHFHNQLVIAFIQCGSNIKVEWSEASCMLSYFYVIYPYIGFPVHSSEVQ